VQHLAVWTSSNATLRSNFGWLSNAATLGYNHRFGFGVIDAKKFVTAAKEWENVGPQEQCQIDPANSL
jgi:hypothetical protein